jgi:hypothetical protein
VKYIPSTVPPGVVTKTATAPVPAGDVTVIDPALLAVIVPGLPAPKLTAVAPLRFCPVILTVVPPPAGPELGLTLVLIGGGT